MRERHPCRDLNGFAVRSLIASSVILSERFDPFAAMHGKRKMSSIVFPIAVVYIVGIYRGIEEIPTGNDAQLKVNEEQ